MRRAREMGEVTTGEFLGGLPQISGEIRESDRALHEIANSRLDQATQVRLSCAKRCGRNTS